MNAFPFRVTWLSYDGEHEEGFESKNEAIQFALATVNGPSTANVQTTYVDEEGNTYLVVEGCW